MSVIAHQVILEQTAISLFRLV